MSIIIPQRRVTLREASGTLSANDTSTPVYTLAGYRHARVDLIIENIDLTGGETLDFWLQTTYDGGTSWVDIENRNYSSIHNGLGDARLMYIGPDRPDAQDVAEDATDGGLAIDNKLDLPLGSGLRFKVEVSAGGGYEYSARARFF